MKGSPFRELILVLVLGGLLAVPLIGLTRRPAAADPVHSHAPSSDTERVGAWLDLRFSHPPETVKVWQGDRLLMEDGGDTRLDADAELDLPGDVATLRMEAVWPDGVEQAYAELSVEPEFRQAKTVGFWGSGAEERRWELHWSEASP